MPTPSLQLQPGNITFHLLVYVLNTSSSTSSLTEQTVNWNMGWQMTARGPNPAESIYRSAFPLQHQSICNRDHMT